ncbi:50S ribosome-binding GTPase, partial [Salmonella enterica subsp. enterica serovar Corvallis]|nr:50S ribosome-binding GTPase [Salmonella enterica subsp. enterica serovar Corvallis]
SVFSEIGFEVFESRIKTVTEIMKALENSSVRTIGIWGPGGVGKTTIVKAIAKKALEMKLFKVVVMATVTRNPEIKTIQGQIADMLGMTLEEETEMGRAGQLRERLKKDKENTLVVLDDLWDGLDLDKLGVPVHDDDTDQKTKQSESILPGNKGEEEISGDNYGGCK